MRVLMIFFIKLFEYTLGALFLSLFGKSSSNKSSFNKAKRNSRNQSLYPKQNDNIIRFSFGKYKGEPIEKIWNSNRDYIDWLRENIDLTKYPNEEFAIENLVNSEV